MRRLESELFGGLPSRLLEKANFRNLARGSAGPGQAREDSEESDPNQAGASPLQGNRGIITGGQEIQASPSNTEEAPGSLPRPRATLHRRQNLLRTSKKIEKSIVYEKQDVYSKMTQLNFEDIFCKGQAAIKEQLHRRKRRPETDAEPVDDYTCKRHSSVDASKARRETTATENPLVNALDGQAHEGAEDYAQAKPQASTVAAKRERRPGFEARLKRKKDDLVEEVVKCFNGKVGDDIDRHIFMKDIIDYLEVNIDDIRKRYNVKKLSLAASPASGSLPPIKDQLGRSLANVSPQKVIISKNFDVNEYREKLASIQSQYAKYNLPPGMSEEEALKQKKMLQSVGLRSKNPQLVVLTPSTLKHVNQHGGTSESYKHNRSMARMRKNAQTLLSQDDDGGLDL